MIATRGQKYTDFRLGRRHTDRHFRRGFGGSVIKNLTELITNADSEYCFVDRERESAHPKSFYGRDLDRLIARTHSKRKEARPIIVVADERRRRFQVIDHGRGFPSWKMERTILAEIGEDMAHVLGEKGEPKRSLFGEGLSAVLWVQKKGDIKSIVNDHLHELKTVDVAGVRKLGFPKVSKRKVQPTQRQAFRIPAGNGTLVEFELDSSVRKSWPSEDTLLSWLNNYWALRMINLDPYRDLILIYRREDGTEHEHRCRFRFPSDAHKLCQDLDRNLVFQGHTIRVTGTLWRSQTPLNMTPDEDRRNGLLVIDENDACYDLQFFDFDRNEHTSNLFGILRLDGAASAIRELTNQGQQVLRDDREGFDRRHPLYRRLATEIVNPWLKPVVEQQRRERLQAGRASPGINRALGKALRTVNSIYREITEPEQQSQADISGPDYHPANGLEFLGSKQREASIATTTILELVVDPSLFTILPSARIEFESSGGIAQVAPNEVSLASANRSLTKRYVRVSPTSAGDGKVSALAIRDDGVATSTEVAFAFQEETVPMVPDGLAFIPDHSHVVPNRRHALRLYVDTNVFPPGTVIMLSIEEREGDNGRLSLELEQLKVPDDAKCSDHVAKLSVYVIGYAEGHPLAVRAQAPDGRTAVATVRVAKRSDLPGKAHFGLPEYRALTTKQRTQWDNDPAGSGAIIINAADPVNRQYFGEDTEAFRQALDGDPHARLLLAELMMEEIVLSTYTKMEIDGKVGNHPTKAEAIRNTLAMLRNRYGTTLHNALLSKASLRRLGVIL